MSSKPFLFQSTTNFDHPQSAVAEIEVTGAPSVDR